MKAEEGRVKPWQECEVMWCGVKISLRPLRPVLRSGKTKALIVEDQLGFYLQLAKQEKSERNTDN